MEAPSPLSLLLFKLTVVSIGSWSFVVFVFFFFEEALGDAGDDSGVKTGSGVGSGISDVAGFVAGFVTGVASGFFF